jgi:hypothetical protein
MNMILKPRPEPETLQEILEASICRTKLREKIADIDPVTRLNLFVPIIKTNIQKQDIQNIKILWFLIFTGIICIFLIGISALSQRPWLIWSMVVFVSVCGFIADSIGRFFPTKAIEGVEMMTEIVKSSRSTGCLSPVLDILSVDSKTNVAKHELSILGNTLVEPLYQTSYEQAQNLSIKQRQALEKLVFGDTKLELTISGLLVLGNAGHVVEAMGTARSWALCPDRRGAAAREYLSAIESLAESRVVA